MKNKLPTKHILSKALLSGIAVTMGGLALIACGLMSKPSWAETPGVPSTRTFPIVERANHGKRIHETKAELTDLTSDTAFEGKYFQIVLGTSSTAVPFNSDPELVLRAASVYHHLTIARAFYKKLPMDTAHLDKQTTVRIDQELPFSTTIHFVTNGQKVNNGALTIPGSDDMKADKTPNGEVINPWNNEIWFFKAKTVTRTSPLAAVGEELGSTDFKMQMMGQLLYQDATGVGTSLVNGTFNATSCAISMSMSIGLSELVPDTIMLLGKIIKQRYYLDTAMIPEIVYHEYGHIALGPTLGFKRPTPIIEGYPNYFASKISGLPDLAGHAHKYNHGDMPKRGFTKMTYSFDQEETAVELDKAFGAEGERILLQAIKYLNESSDLRSDFELAVTQAIDDVGSHPEALKLSALAVYQLKGM